MENLIAICLFFLIMYFPVIKPIIKSIKSAKNSIEKKKTADFMDYDKSSQVLTLKVRTPENERVLKITEYKKPVVKYEPKRMVYTGASAGGITMGGFHEEGGYNYIAGAEKTGRFNLLYLDADLPIKKIQLTDDLYEQAKSSDISEYLNKFKQIVVIDQGISMHTSFAVQAGAPLPLLKDRVEQDLQNNLPTYEKCQRILRWVCDKKRELIKKEGASETEGAITSLDGIAACWDMLLSDRDK